MIWSPDDFNRAIDFAATAHNGQKVPGKPYSYIVHLANVAMEVMAALAYSPSRDGNLAILCALLHDTIEDTSTTAAEIEKEFGSAVARGVTALTKDDTFVSEERMEDSLSRILEQPPEIGMVKMADRITNLQKPPAEWDKGKVVRYYDEAKRIHSRLGRLNARLSERLASRLRSYADYIEYMGQQ